MVWVQTDDPAVYTNQEETKTLAQLIEESENLRQRFEALMAEIDRLKEDDES